jgi:hypothetical protein
MRFSGKLKAQNCFSSILAMGMAPSQELGLGNPNAILILPELDLRKRHDHEETLRPDMLLVNTVGN